MERDIFCCSDCGSDATTLAVHHRYYVKGREPWEYPMFALVTLCETCHSDRHNKRELDPDEHYEPLDGWELAFDMICNGNAENPFIWDLGCEIMLVSKDCDLPHALVTDKIMNMLSQLRSKGPEA